MDGMDDPNSMFPIWGVCMLQHVTFSLHPFEALSTI